MTDAGFLAPVTARALSTAPWGLVSYSVAAGPLRTGVLDAGGVVRALEGALGSGTMLDLLVRWERTAEAIADLRLERLAEVHGARLDVPVRLPPKLIFAGANYYDHAREMGTEVPDGVQPFFFFKPPSTTLIADGAPIPVSAAAGSRIDWEAELGVVIGRRAQKVSREDAGGLVAGYVVLNDITDRSRLARAEPILGAPFAFDWLAAKAQDSSCPMGAMLVPAGLVAEPHNLAVRLWVNGKLKQDGCTADMVADIPALLEAVSDVMTLEPGDIVATGTPAGVGVARGEFLRPGDVVTAEVEGVGRVTNHVVEG